MYLAEVTALEKLIDEPEEMVDLFADAMTADLVVDGNPQVLSFQEMLQCE